MQTQAQAMVLLEDEPVFELVSFEAKPEENGGIALSWITAEEGIGIHFEVERSSDRMNWTSAIAIDGEGDMDGYAPYEATDVTPLIGISYYRLVISRMGEELEVSDDFSVEYAVDAAFRIQNDRTHGHFTIASTNTITDVQILNNRGQFLPMAIDYDGDLVRINAESLEIGTYFVQAMVNGIPVIQKLIITASGAITG